MPLKPPSSAARACTMDRHTEHFLFYSWSQGGGGGGTAQHTHTQCIIIAGLETRSVAIWKKILASIPHDLEVQRREDIRVISILQACIYIYYSCIIYICRCIYIYLYFIYIYFDLQMYYPVFLMLHLRVVFCLYILGVYKDYRADYRYTFNHTRWQCHHDLRCDTILLLYNYSVYIYSILGNTCI